MKKLLAIIKKEFIIISRDIHSVVALFLLPAIFIIVMSLAMRDLYESHSVSKIDLLVINYDENSNSLNYIEILKKLNTFKITTIGKRISKEELKKKIFDEDYNFALIIKKNFSLFVENKKWTSPVFVDTKLRHIFTPLHRQLIILRT